MAVYYLFFAAIITAIYFLYYLVTKNNDYWKKRNVAHLKPSILFGNYGDYILFKKPAPLVAQEICQKFPEEPYVGVFYGTDPALIVQDTNIIKLIFAKDFYYFNSREIFNHTHKESITQNMFFTGGDRWKVLRQNLNSLFSSSKLRNMFYLIEKCATSLDKAIDEKMRTSDDKIIEIKFLMARYTMDCIGSCAFGINTGTLEKDDPTNPFVIISEKLFDITYYGGFKWVFRAMWPSLFYALGFELFSRDITHFFNKLITGVFEKRKNVESSRNDFVDQILSWRKNDYLAGDSVTNLKTGEKNIVKLEINNELLVAQCALFFAAGFETTSTTTSFTLYELAKHQDAQFRVIEEITEYYQRHEGKIEYECINEMPYLQACIDETLRLYPVLGQITREVMEDYTLPTGLVLEKGTRIHIPIHHIHHNHKFFPDPEEFRPERFYSEEKKKIIQYTYVPFGEGPRICLGLRFARMPIVSALLTVFKKYRVELADDMPRSVNFQPKSFVTHAIGGIRLKFIPRS